MREFLVGSRPVGQGCPCYIIAEAGVNHKCDLDTALAMIEKAKQAGADAIKFQTYKADTLVTRWAPRYWQDPEPSGTQHAIFRRSDRFGPEEYRALAEACVEHAIHFISTPFDLPSVDLLNDLGVPAFKIASADITDRPLVEKVGATGKPVFLSTGASTMPEIEAALGWLRQVGNESVMVLHCVLSYPTPIEHASLARIPMLQERFPDYAIGLSDHTIPDDCVTVTTAAVALGAKAIEKHFTLGRDLPGDDHYLSVDPALLARTVEKVRMAEQAMGEPYDQPLECELPARENARRSIVAAVDIPAGTKLEPEHLIMKRPGTGISPAEIGKVLGRVTTSPIAEDSLVEWNSLEDE
ncbi:MAG: N-acetylneuraminate synthase family protein [Armatimonadota bacterium]